jgi:Cu(I)/Ag(I) efflux system protein CusF
MTLRNTAIIAAVLAAATPALAQTNAMQDMGMGQQSAQEAHTAVHQATGVVKSVDAGKGKVTIAHGPVKTLNWPAMTMTFSVKDKGLLDKLSVGKRVQVEFEKQGNAYIITSVK